MINTNKQNSKFNNSGFTLLEILVALALFSLVISMVVGIFVSGSGSQRKIIELHTVQREAGYIMETVSRELRMATAIADSNNIGPIPPYSEDQQNNDDHTIEFTNYEDKLVEYCRSDDTGTCSGIGLYIAKNIKNSSGGYVSKNVISSSDVTIEDLK